MLRSIVVFAFLCSGVCHAATVVVFGDSLSAGYGLRPEQAWPALMQKRLRDAGYRHVVVNASISGETTAGGRSRLPATLQAHKPSVVILELGANDGLRGLSLKAMQENLAVMTRTARAAGAKVLIAGMRLPPNYGPDYTQKFHASFAAVAQAEGAALVPFLLEGFADRRELFLSDGIHPAAEAQPRIVDTVWGGLKPLLGKPAG